MKYNIKVTEIQEYTLNNIEADIKNEQVWADGSEDDFEAEMHEDNIALLEEELEYYNEQLEEVSKM